MRTPAFSLLAPLCRPLRRASRLLLLLTFFAALPVASFAGQAPKPDPQTAKPAPRAHAAKPEEKSSPAAHKKAAASRARKHAAAKTAAKPEPAPVLPAVAPIAPPKPDWPVNDRPKPAAITWDAAGLHIQAANSSLQQILKEVSTLTGATVEGLTSDERVYGVFGPAPARDVLARLFYGSRYNILLVGDQGQGTPRRIVLSMRDSKSTPQVAGAKPVDDDAEDEVITDDQSQEQDQQQQRQPPQAPLIRNTDQNGQPQSNPGQPPQNNPQ